MTIAAHDTNSGGATPGRRFVTRNRSTDGVGIVTALFDATIFLDAPFPTLYDRCMLQDIARPVLADPTAAEQRFAKRHPLYRRLANLTIPTTNQSPDQTVEAILNSNLV